MGVAPVCWVRERSRLSVRDCIKEAVSFRQEFIVRYLKILYSQNNGPQVNLFSMSKRTVALVIIWSHLICFGGLSFGKRFK